MTPAGSDPVTVALVPKASCDAPGAICTADGRGLGDEVEAEVPGRAPTRVVSATVTSGPGENGVWDEGETVEAQVRFSREVGVHGPPGVGPVLTILLDGTAYEAAYTGGSGTDTFSFSYTVTAAAAGAASAGVAPNGLSPNGVILGDNEGQEVEPGFELEPDPAAPPTRLTVVRTLAENAAPGAAVGPPVVAGDPDGDPLTYALDGEDADAFAIDAATGQLRTKAGVFYDYELKPAYSVLVVADDGNGNSGSIGVRIELSDVEETLTARIEGAPETHGGVPFAVRLQFSEPVEVEPATMRDSVVAVTNGRATQARRLDRDRDLRAMTGRDLSALWELTIEPSGGAVTVAVPATAQCGVADAVCTIDGRRLSAGAAAVPVAEGTLPALTAAFGGAPEAHDGSDAFTLELGFTGPVTTAAEVMRSQALRVTNGRVTEARHEEGRRDRWLLTVEPASLQDVTVALEAGASCADAGAVCTPDGRTLSRREEARVKGPASIPLKAKWRSGAATHDGSTPFELGVTFSWPVTTTRKAVRTHGLRVANGEVLNVSRVRNLDTKWTFQILPLSNATVTVELPKTSDCAAAGAVCTGDGRMLSNKLDWEVSPQDPDAVDETPPELRRAEVDGAALVLLYYEGLDEAAVPEAAAFTVTVGGAPRALAADDAVRVIGRRARLRLASAVAQGDAVTVAYTMPSSNRLRDMAGNAAETLGEQPVTNRTLAPAFEEASVNADSVVLSYGESLDEASVPPAQAFTVTVGGEPRALAADDAVAVSGQTVTLTLASAVAHGEAVTVSYAVPSSDRLRDTAETPAGALTGGR